MGNRPLKVLIADRETLVSRRIKEYLSANVIECEVVNGGKQLKELLTKWIPDFILVDLLLPDCSAMDLLELLKTAPFKGKSIGVMVTSSHNSAKNVKQVFTNGAIDYIVKPFKMDDILARIVFHLQRRATIEQHPKENKEISVEGSALYLHLVELILREGACMRNPREKLFSFMQMLALSMKAVRCSVIRTDMENLEGMVIASSDDIRVKKINIDLAKYPEVTHTVNTAKTTVIENLDFNPELARLKKIVKTISFNAIIVTPVLVNGEVFGVVSCRIDSKNLKVTDLQIRFCEIMAFVCSMVISSVDFLPYLETKKSRSKDAA
jgi:DNA-binding response OmpR family regulator